MEGAALPAVFEAGKELCRKEAEAVRDARRADLVAEVQQYLPGWRSQLEASDPGQWPLTAIRRVRR